MSLTVDTRAFNQMVRELSKMSGAPVKQVILAETGKILENCVSSTPVRSAQAIERSVRFQNRNLWEDAQWPPKARGNVVVSITKTGAPWFVDEPGPQYSGVAQGRKVGSKTFHPMEFFHWSRARWARYQNALSILRTKQQNLGNALGSRGLAAHSWWQIAASLGIQINVPAYVRNARPRNGQVYINGMGQKFETPTSFFVEIANNNPTLVGKLGGAGILTRAIQRRITHFGINVAKAVFNDLKRRARLYPGVFVT